MTTEREDRIDKLVAVCVTNRLNPDCSLFVPKIRDLCVKLFKVSAATAQSYIDSLISLWYKDHWRSIIGTNYYLLKAKDAVK